MAVALALYQGLFLFIRLIVCTSFSSNNLASCLDFCCFVGSRHDGHGKTLALDHYWCLVLSRCPKTVPVCRKYLEVCRYSYLFRRTSSWSARCNSMHSGILLFFHFSASLCSGLSSVTCYWCIGLQIESQCCQAVCLHIIHFVLAGL